MTGPELPTDGALLVLEPERKLQGNQFEPVAEADLHPVLLDLASTFRGSDLLVAIPEFYGVFGIADLAVLAARRASLEARLRADVPPLTYELDTIIVSTLSATKPQSLARLVQRTGADHRAVEERIRRYLTANGAVRRTQTGSLVRHRALVPVGRLHALEAKVTDWRRAARQARRYALWADSVSVVLGRLPRDRSYVLDELGRHGIGLAVDSRWLMRPTARRHGLSRRLLASELVISAIGQQVEPGGHSPSSTTY